MSNLGGDKRISAIQQFRRARRKAELRSLLSKITGKQDDLLLFDEVRKTLELAHPNKEKLKDIPLDSIVGTVSRYHDFNRQFYPLSDSDEDRWAKVKELTEVMGLEPIEVYQVGDVYFVLDGNHRVSVARSLDTKTIQAYVKEFRTDVEISPQDDLADVVLRVEYKELMEDTKLDEIRPDVDIRVTLPGRYREILDHIEVHRYFLGLEQEKSITLKKAVASWVDHVYLPAIRAIRETKVLDDFPERTETDLYLWLKKHQWELEQALDQDVADVDAAMDLKKRFSGRFLRRLKRIWKRISGGS